MEGEAESVSLRPSRGFENINPIAKGFYFRGESFAREVFQLYIASAVQAILQKALWHFSY